MKLTSLFRYKMQFLVDFATKHTSRHGWQNMVEAAHAMLCHQHSMMGCVHDDG